MNNHRITLGVSYDAGNDVLLALVPGTLIDGLPDDQATELLDGLFLYRSESNDVVGFSVSDAFSWAVSDQDEDVVWGDDGRLRFDAPTLALRHAALGEIVLAAQRTLAGSTPDVVLFDQAVSASNADRWDEAEGLWRLCLATGEMKAHFGLGYTLVELGRPRIAFGHLAMYTELVPRMAWAWVWRGRAAHDMGETAEARACFARAAQLDEDAETDALERLEALG